VSAGRPSIYSAELADTIIDGITSGLSLRAICRADGMPDRATVFRWLEARPDFAAKYARAREFQAEANAEEIIDIADDEDDAQRARVRIDARKWVAAKLLPKRYGDKATVQHEGGDKPIETVALTPMEAARRVAFVLDAARRQITDKDD
jgi:hypothetical protein